MVNLTSPAALKPPDSGPENGWTIPEKMLCIITMMSSKSLVSSDKSYRGSIRGVIAVIRTFHISASSKDSLVSFFIYHSAASVSQAPIH